MKEYAKSLVHAKLPLKRESQNRRPSAEPAPAPAPPPLPTDSVYRQQDSWAVRNRRGSFTNMPNGQQAPAPLAPDQPEEPENAPAPEGGTDESFTYVKYRAKRQAMFKPHKVRRITMSICVSEQEHDILTDWCQEKGVSVSEYVRNTVFRSIGRAIPTRNIKGRKRNE